MSAWSVLELRPCEWCAFVSPGGVSGFRLGGNQFGQYGRGKFVQITKAGRELLDKVLPDHLTTEETILAPRSTDERNMLAQLLSKLTATAN
ncbi:hypothetical protein FB472_1790 [Rhodoglobus vestalii]|uniref:Winged helix DNA-binding protein n=1 Tax=Rhodoglobus vestalii TaxID=193384 RepID=A0A8H2K758_9MICO|nr:hypothetical protein FB472_1790 [Rhodoglobus vestalii]